MGYRSDVKCITTKEGFELIDKLVRKASGITKENEDFEYWLTDEFNTSSIANDKYMLMEYDDIKWYSNDPAVQAFEQALERLEAQKIPYQFIRAGEDDEDVERKYGEPSDWQVYKDMPQLWLERKIVVEY